MIKQENRLPFPKGQKFVFLDRDGIINVDHGYVYRPRDFEFVPGFTELLGELFRRDFEPVVVTNQSGVARGYFTLGDVVKFHDTMNEKLFEILGRKIDHIYICPHHPNGTNPQYTAECNCRKPKPGLVQTFLEDTGFSSHLEGSKLNSSFWEGSILIGDKTSDVELGKRIGVKTFQLNGGNYPVSPDVDHEVKSLAEIVPILDRT